jgi:uncharacterized protein
VFSGLTGVGGGAILVSLLVSWLDLNQHRAQGTTPVAILPVALAGAATYLIQGFLGVFRFDGWLALTLIPALALPSIAGVVIGGTWMAALPASQLRRAFGVFLFFVAFSMLTRGILPIGTPNGASLEVPFIFWVLLGFVSGVFSGFLGIGGAMVMIPFMTLGAGIPQHMTQGVSLAVVAVTTMAGALTQLRLQNVEMNAIPAMLPGSLIAVLIASLLAGRLDSFWLTKIFGVVMLYFGYQFTFRPIIRRLRTPSPDAGYYSI